MLRLIFVGLTFTGVDQNYQYLIKGVYHPLRLRPGYAQVPGEKVNCIRWLRRPAPHLGRDCRAVEATPAPPELFLAKN